MLESPNLKEALNFYQRKRGNVTVLREIFNILDSSQKTLQKTRAYCINQMIYFREFLDN